MTPTDHAISAIRDVMHDMPDGEAKALLEFAIAQLTTPSKAIPALLRCDSSVTKGHTS